MPESKAKKKKSKRWMLFLPTIVGGVVLFFVLPFLETPRQHLLRLFGINLEEPKAVSEFPYPEPLEISNDIGNAPLLQQDEVAQHYVGIQVEWTGKLASIEKQDSDMLRLQVCISRRFARTICFFADIKSADYPGIGLLKTENEVRVNGFIERANSNWIILRDAKLIQYQK